MNDESKSAQEIYIEMANREYIVSLVSENAQLKRRIAELEAQITELKSMLLGHEPGSEE